VQDAKSTESSGIIQVRFLPSFLLVGRKEGRLRKVITEGRSMDGYNARKKGREVREGRTVIE
jgi:hypothetical protein